jgi:pimeloyl-ACP methyl ester carboxylesterase
LKVVVPRAPVSDAPVPLYYEDQGHGAAVLVLHGLFGSSSNWRSFAKRLAEDLRVIAVDLRNHGRSAHAERIDYPSMAGDVLALLDELGLPGASLVGHSMGGKVAMESAVAHPARVERLVVLDIAPRAAVDGPREVLEALLDVDLMKARSRQDVDAQLAPRLSDPALRAFLLMGITRNESGGFEWKFDPTAIAANWNAIVAGVSPGIYDGPTLFVRGERSGYVRDADVPEIRARFPSARIETIERAGHWLHAEAPDETFRAVREFLRDAD